MSISEVPAFTAVAPVQSVQSKQNVSRVYDNSLKNDEFVKNKNEKDFPICGCVIDDSRIRKNYQEQIEYWQGQLSELNPDNFETHEAYVKEQERLNAELEKTLKAYDEWNERHDAGNTNNFTKIMGAIGGFIKDAGKVIIDSVKDFFIKG